MAGCICFWQHHHDAETLTRQHTPAPRRLKREEARIAKEMEEREQEEARRLLEAAQKKIGSKRLNIADGATLDKASLMNQVPAAGPLSPLTSPL
jgi:hypothetical protein